MGCSSLAGGCSGRFLTMHKRRRKKLMTRSLSQDVAILDDIHHGQVQYILDRCGLWGFNAFTLETVAGGRSLPVLCVHLFHWYGLLDHFRLDVVRVWKLFSLIEEGYHSTNPYHNSIHATDVTQAMHCFLQEEKIRRHVTPVEIMAALIGAVAHDLDHPGVNQHFLISTSNHLAILYENRSVLENHHWRSALGCLLESGVAEQVVEIREDLENQIRDLILATDINRQQEFLTKFRNHLDDDTLDLTIAENRQFILQIALKCADISNPTRPWDISHKWSLKVCDEFFRQGNYERELNLPITSICDQQSTTVAKIQSGFFKYVVTPLFCEWHRFLHSALSTHMTELLEANRQRWVDQERAELQQETVKEVTGLVHTEVVLSETDIDPELREVTSEDEESRKGDLSSGAPSIIMEFISPPHHPREMRRQSLAVPGLETLPGGLRRHSVPVNILEPDTAGNTSGIALPPTAMGHLPRTILRRESLPGRSTRGTSPTALGESSRASSGLRTDDYDELMKCCYGGSQTSVSSGSGGIGQYGSTTMDEGNGERPLSAETLLPEHSIASMTSSVGVQAGRLSSVLQGTVLSSVQMPSTGGGTTKLLTRQQTFPPPQPYMRMRYMSATAEMSTCKETVHEVDDSRSNSSHGSHENISPKQQQQSTALPVLIQPLQHYAIPSIAVLSPSNGRAPEILLAETTAAKPPQSGNSSHKRESSHVDVAYTSTDKSSAEKAPKMAKFSCDVGTTAVQSHQQKENVDPRRFASSLTKRRGSAPLNLPLMLPDENAPPAGRSVYSTTTEMAHTLRRGSVPIEITRYRCEDSTSGGAMLPPVDHPATASFHHPHNLWRYQSQQRRGSAPTTTTVTPTTAKELLLLTRHTSLNGNAGKQQQQRRNGGSANNSGILGKKQQLRRRSSGGPETVRLSEVAGFEGGSCSMLLRQMSPLTGSASVTGIGGVASETLLARRRGSLPIEVLSVGNSVF